MAKLTPPDLERCQSERREGSFMTLGPRPWVRCEEKPTHIATELSPGADGQIGSTSLCAHCARVLLLQRADIVITRIEETSNA